jgi:hypothetical protein
MNEQYLIRLIAYIIIITAAFGYARALLYTATSRPTGSARIIISYLRISIIGFLFLQFLLYLPQIDLILGGVLFIGSVWARIIYLTAQEYSDGNRL